MVLNWRDDNQDPFDGTWNTQPFPAGKPVPINTDPTAEHKNPLPPNLAGYQPGNIGGSAGSSGSSSGFFNSGGVKPTPASTFDDKGISDLLAGNLKGLLASPSRYNPEVMTSIRGGILSSTTGRAKVAKQNATDDAIGRGMARSGALGSTLAGIDRGAAQDYTQQNTELLTKKVDADRQDRLDALDRSQQWLDHLRDYTLRSDINQIERDRLQSQIALGYAQISAQREALAKNSELSWNLALLGREPIEGRDFIYIQNPGEPPPGHKVYNSVLDRTDNYLGALQH